MTPDEALDELLRCANLQFDPRVVEALCEVVTEAPSRPRAAATEKVSVLRRELPVGADA